LEYSRVILAREEAGRSRPCRNHIRSQAETPQIERERIIACGGRVFAVEYDDGIDGPNACLAWSHGRARFGHVEGRECFGDVSAF
jgi:hypothetical protein